MMHQREEDEVEKVQKIVEVVSYSGSRSKRWIRTSVSCFDGIVDLSS